MTEVGGDVAGGNRRESFAKRLFEGSHRTGLELA